MKWRGLKSQGPLWCIFMTWTVLLVCENYAEIALFRYIECLYEFNTCFFWGNGKI